MSWNPWRRLILHVCKKRTVRENGTKWEKERARRRNNANELRISGAAALRNFEWLKTVWSVFSHFGERIQLFSLIFYSSKAGRRMWWSGKQDFQQKRTEIWPSGWAIREMRAGWFSHAGGRYGRAGADIFIWGEAYERVHIYHFKGKTSVEGQCRRMVS